MKTVPLILFLSVSTAVVAAPTQQGKPEQAQQTAVQPRRGFFGSVKQFFKRPFERQPDVVKVPTAQPNRVVYKKRQNEPAQQTASRPSREEKQNRSASRNERARQERSVAATRPETRPTAERQAAPQPQSAERSATVAPRNVTPSAPTGYLAPVSNPTEPVAPAPAPARETATPAVPTAAASGPAASAFDRERYLKAKAEAAQDPQVKALALKLESAQPGEEYKAAARDYTKALFSKIREVDSSQNDWIERLEAATLRRIDEGKAIVVE